VDGLVELGKLTREERSLLHTYSQELKSLPSGRWLWVGNTDWIKNPDNFSGAYNCTSTAVRTYEGQSPWAAFGWLLNLGMMGCGTGAVLETEQIETLPAIFNHLSVQVAGEPGEVPKSDRLEDTEVHINRNTAYIIVGDSRQGWVDAYQSMLEIASDIKFGREAFVHVYLGNVRPYGELLQGFGGVANPVKLGWMFGAIASITNGVVGRQMNALECCMVIDVGAETVVAGNLRRSAGMRQGSWFDSDFTDAKLGLYAQDAEGNWYLPDPRKSVLRIANHTRVYHHKPTLDELKEAVAKQYHSGEGAIMWAGEAIYRANRDLISDRDHVSFLSLYNMERSRAREFLAVAYLRHHGVPCSEEELDHRMERHGLNPCITGDTWIHTEKGARRVKDILNQQQAVYVNGELFSTTHEGFFQTGVQPVIRIETQQGYSIRLTSNHKILKVTAQTQKKQYSEWIEAGELKIGDRVMIHDHRKITPWLGDGVFEEGWLLGSLLGDGSLAKHPDGDQGMLRFWGETKQEMGDYAVQCLSLVSGYKGRGHDHRQLQHRAVNSAWIARLASRFGMVIQNKVITPVIEQASYDFYRGFLRGLFDADGSVQGSQEKGVSVRLAQSNLDTLLSVQRMLLRLGIASQVYKNRRIAQWRQLPGSDRLPKGYYCKAQHELVISKSNLLEFNKLIGFQEPEKAEKLKLSLSEYNRELNRERFCAKIKSITADGTEPVYDCMVPGVNRFDANGFVAHNCGEIIGSNFHCVSGDTLLVTRCGMYSIKDVVGSEVEIWNGKRWSAVTPFKTGSDRELYRLRFSDGSYIDATEQHRWFVKVQFQNTYSEATTKELVEYSQACDRAIRVYTEPFEIEYDDGVDVGKDWAYALGFAVGLDTPWKEPATTAVAHSGQLETIERVKTIESSIEFSWESDFLAKLKHEAQSLNIVAAWNKPCILSFIAGLADADGSDTQSGVIRIYLSGFDRAKRVQLLLLKCGIPSSIVVAARPGGSTSVKRDLYAIQVVNSSSIPCQRLVSNGIETSEKWQAITSIEKLPGRYDTYCFNEPEFHKGVFGATLAGNCNLAEIHLNQFDPNNLKEQEEAFTAGALNVAVLLHHKFTNPIYQKSREMDPIVGVSFTGLFDFFVKRFGYRWLQWWRDERPKQWGNEVMATPVGERFDQTSVNEFEYESEYFLAYEAWYLNWWRQVVEQKVGVYCDRHKLKRPNRCTTVQPSGSKSLLTGASPGWHPPKGQRYIRRITFDRNDPVALACLDMGYSVVPAQGDKGENGYLLTDPFDPRCTEHLVEIPCEVSWANLPGVEGIDVSQFSALAQIDFYMMVQKHYTRHNTSATIEMRSHEIEAVAERLHEAIQNDEGYISACLQARFDDHETFPRLPFEPIDKEMYQQMVRDVEARRTADDFQTALAKRQEESTYIRTSVGPAGCDSDKCMTS
jgi:intein/homing endonuclease